MTDKEKEKMNGIICEECSTPFSDKEEVGHPRMCDFCLAEEQYQLEDDAIEAEEEYALKYNEVL